MSRALDELTALRDRIEELMRDDEISEQTPAKVKTRIDEGFMAFDDACALQTRHEKEINHV